MDVFIVFVTLRTSSNIKVFLYYFVYITHLHSSTSEQITVAADDTKKNPKKTHPKKPHCFANTTRNKQKQSILLCQRC